MTRNQTTVADVEDRAWRDGTASHAALRWERHMPRCGTEASVHGPFCWGHSRVLVSGLGQQERTCPVPVTRRRRCHNAGQPCPQTRSSLPRCRVAARGQVFNRSEALGRERRVHASPGSWCELAWSGVEDSPRGWSGERHRGLRQTASAPGHRSHVWRPTWPSCVRVQVPSWGDAPCFPEQPCPTRLFCGMWMIQVSLWTPPLLPALLLPAIYLCIHYKGQKNKSMRRTQ